MMSSNIEVVSIDTGITNASDTAWHAGIGIDKYKSSITLIYSDCLILPTGEHNKQFATHLPHVVTRLSVRFRHKNHQGTLDVGFNTCFCGNKHSWRCHVFLLKTPRFASKSMAGNCPKVSLNLRM